MNYTNNEDFIGITISFEKEIISIKASFDNNLGQVIPGKIFKINKNSSYYGIIISNTINSLLSEDILIEEDYKLYNKENFPEYKYLLKSFYKGICIENNFILNLYEPVFIINKIDYKDFFNKKFIKKLLLINILKEDSIKILSNIINLYFQNDFDFIKEFLNNIFIESNRNYDFVKNITKNIH